MLKCYDGAVTFYTSDRLCGFGAYGTINILDVRVCTHVHTYTGLYSLHNFGPKWMYICVYFVHTCMCVIVRTYVELNMCWWTMPLSSVGTLRNECHCIHLAQSIFIKGPTVLHNGVHQSNPFGQYGLQQSYIQSVTVCIVIALWQYICDSTKGSVCVRTRARVRVCACACAWVSLWILRCFHCFLHLLMLSIGSQLAWWTLWAVWLMALPKLKVILNWANVHIYQGSLSV